MHGPATPSLPALPWATQFAHLSDDELLARIFLNQATIARNESENARLKEQLQVTQTTARELQGRLNAKKRRQEEEEGEDDNGGIMLKYRSLSSSLGAAAPTKRVPLDPLRAALMEVEAAMHALEQSADVLSDRLAKLTAAMAAHVFA